MSDVPFSLIVFALRNQIAVAVEVMKESARALVAMPLIAAFPIATFFALIAYLIFWYTPSPLLSLALPFPSFSSPL